MAKGNKEFEWRMQGMIYALNIAKEKGIEGLEKDIRARNILRAPMKFSLEELEEFYRGISGRIYNNILTITYAVLHDRFKFGKDRLQSFKKCFNDKTLLVSTLDKFGNHYATFMDYAVEANKKYDLGIDVALVSAVQDVNEESIYGKEKRVEARAVLGALEENGFQDAAKFLEKRMKPYIVQG